MKSTVNRKCRFFGKKAVFIAMTACFLAAFLEVTAFKVSAYEKNDDRDNKSSGISYDAENKESSKDADIASGFYRISSYIDSNDFLGIKDSSREDGADLQIASGSNTPGQAFFVTNNGDGTYNILNVNSDKVLDLADGKTNAGVSVIQYAKSGSSAQQWKITSDAETGAVLIRAADNEKMAVQPENRTANAGTSLVLGIINGSRLQKWNFISVNSQDDSLNSYSAVSDGIYTLESAVDRTKFLDIAGNGYSDGSFADIAGAKDTNIQKFIIKSDGAGWYTITSLNSGKLLDVKNADTADGTNVQISTADGTAAQKWRFTDNADGSRYIESSLGVFLDVQGGAQAEGTQVDVYRINRTNAQKWYLSPSSAGQLTDGDYVLKAASDPARALDISGGSAAIGTEAGLSAVNGTQAQSFTFTSAGNGYIKITCLISNYLLTERKSDASGTSSAWQYIDNGADSQLWKAEPTGDPDGSYYLTNKKSGFHLTAGENAKFLVQRVSAQHGTVSGLDLSYASAPGQRTVLSFLQNALKPVGRTLYVFDGGWNANPDAGTVDSGLIGYQESWWDFFTSHAVAGYDHTPYTAKYGLGLDCSGYVQWAVYNALYTEQNPYGLLRSFDIAGSYISNGWAYSDNSNFRPGDVVSLDEGGNSGHVYIILGTCRDGSVLLMHSTLVPSTATQGEGVQISGTSAPGAGTDGVTCDSQAAILAQYYMSKYFPEWPYAVVEEPSETYLSGAIVKASWITDGSGIMSDSVGMQDMSGEQVMKVLLGD